MVAGFCRSLQQPRLNLRDDLRVGQQLAVAHPIADPRVVERQGAGQVGVAAQGAVERHEAITQQPVVQQACLLYTSRCV